MLGGGDCFSRAPFLSPLSLVSSASCLSSSLYEQCGGAERSGADGTGMSLLAAAQMREADKNRRGKKQRGGFADDQEDAGTALPRATRSEGIEGRRAGMCGAAAMRACISAGAVTAPGGSASCLRPGAWFQAPHACASPSCSLPDLVHGLRVALSVSLMSNLRLLTVRLMCLCCL